MQHLLQRVVDLGAPAQRLGKRARAHRHDHELLEVHVVVSMHAAVEDVHHGRGQQVRVRAADVLVQRLLSRLSSSLGAGQRRAEDGVRAQGTLVVGAVHLQHDVVDEALIVGLDADERLGDLLVHVGDSIQCALAEIAALVAVAQLDGLERARRSARRHRGTAERAVFQHHFNFHGRVAARVQNLATEHIDDDAHACLLVGFPALPHRHGKDALRGNHSTSEAQRSSLWPFSRHCRQAVERAKREPYLFNALARSRSPEKVRGVLVRDDAPHLRLAPASLAMGELG